MELQELTALAEESKRKKGRMDAVAREKATQLIAHIWSAADLDPSASFDSLTELQSEAVADGIGKAWPEMREAHRDLFLSWLPTPASDRTSRRVGLIAAAIIDSDGRRATDLLCRLLPVGRRNVSKEIRQMLRSVLFGEKRINFENLSQPGTSPETLMKVYSALVEIAFDPASDVSPVVRSRFALALRASMRFLESHDIQKTRELQARLADEMKRWPSALQEQFQRQLELIESTAEAQSSLSEGPALSSPSRPSEAIVEPPIVYAKADVVSQLSIIQDQLDNRVAAISKDVELLRQLGTVVAEIKKQYQSLQTELETAKEQVAQSTGRERQAFEMNRNLESRLEEQTAKMSDLSKALDQTKSEKESERKHLSQQISANAAGRIDEFKNRLGLILARLVVDLPQKDASVSAELGRVLLLQFHQFLEALRHEGIETRPRIAARS
jgi:hypothetical protein